jgi:hypothetical protein
MFFLSASALLAFFIYTLCEHTCFVAHLPAYIFAACFKDYQHASG